MQSFFKHFALKSIPRSSIIWALLWGIFVLLTINLLDFSGESAAILLFGSLPFVGHLVSQIRQLSEHKDLRFSLLNDISADVVVLDNNGKIVFINEFAISDSQLRSAAIGKTMLEYGQLAGRSPAVSQAREKAIRKAIQNKKEFEWEESVYEKGQQRDYIRQVTPVYQNRRLSNLIVYGLEISERKKAEQEVQRRAAIQKTINYFSTSLFNLNSEEDILWDIAKNCIRELEFVDAVVYTLDRERKVLVQRAAYGNKEDGEFAIYEPIEIPLGKGIVGNVALTGKPELVSNTSLDDRYILDDEVRLSELAVPIIGPGGTLGVLDSEHPEKNFFTEEHLSILTIIANIAANKIIRARVVEDLASAKEKAELATAAKSNFLSSMSHEIRTPLNAVIGLSHLLNDEIKEPEHKESLQTLLSSAEHLLSLINDILDFSKIEEGKLVLNKTTFSLAPLIEELLNPFRFLADEKNLDFFSHLPPVEIPKLIGDDTRLRQILTNLIGNALKFTRVGSISLKCRLLSQDEENCFFRFEVTDTGIGIAKEQQASIFEQFIQAKEDTTRKFGGTGLGLSIARKLVELQGGQIGVESNNDPTLGPTGTTFWFEVGFPLAKEERNSASIKTDPNQQLGPLLGLSVLLVEDNRVNVIVARRFLEKWQVEVTHADNGLIATQMVQQKKFGLILMDLNMPVMGGLQATAVIRSSGNQIPIIALTADATAEVREKVFEQEMNGYLTKPFKPADLHQALSQFLPQKDKELLP
ncbi:MAG: response regulator [Bacteroidota bacterium]